MGARFPLAASTCYSCGRPLAKLPMRLKRKRDYEEANGKKGVWKGGQEGGTKGRQKGSQKRAAVAEKGKKVDRRGAAREQ